MILWMSRTVMKKWLVRLKKLFSDPYFSVLSRVSTELVRMAY